MSERWTGATGICQRICKAHLFDETFGVNSAFDAEVFVAPPHAVAMEFDLSERDGVVIGLRAAGSHKGNFWLDSALEKRAIIGKKLRLLRHNRNWGQACDSATLLDARRR